MVTYYGFMDTQGTTPKHDAFQAIADPNRRRILEILDQGELSVIDISRHFQVSRPAISKHLRILREAGLVRENRIGRYHYYRLDPEPLKGVVDWMKTFERFWADNLDALQHLLEKGA